eukprot:CAMPEP_0114312110 /NCGR_PEP_ID=MMETSP0059-20121206/20228_1 /TAXON_ID=36894 /ORGANISM="Pyramimonas parkeae, Strain CCMP726" /LENGTH=395 /DNA_ID=CAMNT_0001436419 /DNA_START=157 /DNA_END=1345 /DNA_ORIENTATION=-
MDFDISRFWDTSSESIFLSIATIDLCKVVTIPPRREVFGFGGSQTGAWWKWYDWEQVTAVGFLDENTRDPEDLMCHAHSKGARVFLKADVPEISSWGNATARRVWIESHVDRALRTHADATNFDFEGPITARSREAALYTLLVRETAEEFRRSIPGFQITVDVAWSPSGIDGRWFDYAGLAQAADLLFVMAYDMQSQIWGRCIAQANSPLEMVNYGLQQYLALGIPAEKIVLGVPWYGYTYRCKGEHVAPDAEFCELEAVPFRNVSCSDAAGGEIALSMIMSGPWTNATTPRRWDPILQSPHFNYYGPDGKLHQLWYDDAASLSLKYRLAKDLGLRGVGPWTFDHVFPDSEGQSGHLQQDEVRAMWDAFKYFTGRGGSYAIVNPENLGSPLLHQE